MTYAQGFVDGARRAARDRALESDPATCAKYDPATISKWLRTKNRHSAEFERAHGSDKHGRENRAYYLGFSRGVCA